ncbi:MAG: S41 family peptidase, partial [Tannerellaceae bacterium]
MNSKKVAIWLPIIIASSIALGIFVGNVYKSRNLSGSKGIPSGEGKLDAILNIIDRQYVDTIDVNEIVEEAIPKIFSELDPHSAYIPAKDLQMVNEDLEGSFSGIGIQFNYQTDTVVVVSVITGGPSDKIGLLPGDRIISVNDSTIAGVKASTEKVMKMLRGPKDSIVKLGVQRNTSPELLSFDVTRGDIPVNSVDASFEVDKGIGYIKINKFGRNTYQEFITALAELKAKGCKSFVIDLRSNGGGYMDAAINMVNEFLPKDRLIVYTEGKSFPRRDVFSNGTGTAQEDQVVVLMDDFSASASEIFAGAIQDNDRGTIIGRRSFGKGLVQEQIPLSDGSAIRLTIARYFTPSGRSIQKEYQRGAGEEYEQELYNRFLHGEFDSKDS